MRYLLTISYDGSKFRGFQRLKNNPSVQKTIEDALKVITKKDIKIKGAGRTDAGVHALGQRCHFDLESDFAPDKLKYVLNNIVKPYIYIKDCKIVSDEVHARFSVKKKKYTYKINLGEYNPLISDYVYFDKKKLDVRKMKKASKLFVGNHDFTNFISESKEDASSIINKITFKRKKDILLISFYGISFYRYMVRSMVGALLEVGKNNISDSVIKSMLEDTKIKKKLPVAPPEGLYLDKIWY